MGTTRSLYDCCDRSDKNYRKFSDRSDGNRAEQAYALLFVNGPPPSLLSWLTETVERFIRCPTNTLGLKITEENVLPVLCHLQAAKLSLIRTKNLRPPLTAFYFSPTMLERLRCTRDIKGHFMHFIVMSTKKGLYREQTS